MSVSPPQGVGHVRLRWHQNAQSTSPVLQDPQIDTSQEFFPVCSVTQLPAKPLPNKQAAPEKDTTMRCPPQVATTLSAPATASGHGPGCPGCYERLTALQTSLAATDAHRSGWHKPAPPSRENGPPVASVFEGNGAATLASMFEANGTKALAAASTS